ncbi:uncharacterized protein PITG_10159 [Phytophthora infestans T30-4]|uniref:Uncharacterized protein n=1 Tax=Phytophthora infestans (strain T30-4) TaxID=403677 RepID=D0NEG7_PHYIT|nr:uncharacterized protein PITG_10159 [Phytophthora infestans T30-4]EEY56612.1 conserved hypothetical protein [Phytophthora infestans T30-4]|eukprot:XP_002902686.1 conserved hypothetical protein [Phytophthora infestans T30-4]
MILQLAQLSSHQELEPHRRVSLNTQLTVVQRSLKDGAEAAVLVADVQRLSRTATTVGDAPPPQVGIVAGDFLQAAAARLSQNQPNQPNQGIATLYVIRSDRRQVITIRRMGPLLNGPGGRNLFL